MHTGGRVWRVLEDDVRDWLQCMAGCWLGISYPSIGHVMHTCSLTRERRRSTAAAVPGEASCAPGNNSLVIKVAEWCVLQPPASRVQE